MNIPLNDLYAILDAFKRGYRDAYHRGQYKNSFQGSCSSAYKQGYDFGMTVLAWADGKTIECKRKDGESWGHDSTGTMLKLEAKLAERNRYIEELENRLRSLWDKYYADSNHHMERIKRLEEAGNDLDSWLDRETPVTIRTNWRQAKETKP